MPSLSDTRPHRVQGALSRAVSEIKPCFGSNAGAFASLGFVWGLPYEHDAEPVKRDSPDVMKGYYSFEDSQRMIDADLMRRRNLAQNMLALRRAESLIPRN